MQDHAYNGEFVCHGSHTVSHSSNFGQHVTCNATRIHIHRHIGTEHIQQQEHNNISSFGISQSSRVASVVGEATAARLLPIARSLFDHFRSLFQSLVNAHHLGIGLYYGNVDGDESIRHRNDVFSNRVGSIKNRRAINLRHIKAAL